MSTIDGPGGRYQSQWEHAQVTTASCRLTEARGWLAKEGVGPAIRGAEARKLINIASDILRNIARINSTWRQNDFYTQNEQLAQRFLQVTAWLQEG